MVAKYVESWKREYVSEEADMWMSNMTDCSINDGIIYIITWLLYPTSSYGFRASGFKSAGSKTGD